MKEGGGFPLACREQKRSCIKLYLVSTTHKEAQDGPLRIMYNNDLRDDTFGKFASNHLQLKPDTFGKFASNHLQVTSNCMTFRKQSHCRGEGRERDGSI